MKEIYQITSLLSPPAIAEDKKIRLGFIHSNLLEKECLVKICTLNENN